MTATCEQVQAFVVDETAAPPADLEAHLALCPECRDLKRAHAAALLMRGVEVGIVSRPRIEHIRRRAGIVAGLALVVTGAVGLARLGAAPLPLLDAPRESAQWFEATPLVVVDEEAEWRALTGLAQTVTAASQAEPSRDDLTYRSFGALPGWLAPQTNRPVRALGRAISPVVLTREY
jgi:hypothetical protein